jgi:hypothetical protein
MSKHTPGPWLQEPGDTVICIRATAECESYRIADVGGMPYWKRFTETDVANASLIAAAPDLLAALNECASYIISPLRMTGDTDEAARRAAIFERARAAIAKAEGRDP